ncbi:hypothetical protein OG218_09370 [Kineococcus sp. NBC_00420]|uniref:hypothetical protein n=1 Tax=unclassified Kineococcus TaxID=2621656 RepID=UPI002E23E461
MIDLATLSEEALDTLITTRLALAGVDLAQLPEVADPATGVPTRAAALESLRAFLVQTVPQLNAWEPPVASPEAAQQAAAPLLYPSIATAWAPGSEGGAA